MNLRYVVKKEDEGEFVRYILKQKLKMSSILIRETITKNLIFKNSEICFLKNRVKENDVILVNLDKTYNDDELNLAYSKYTLWKHDLDIIYEDEYILCVNKEAGVACHPSMDNTEKTLYQAIIYYYMKKGIKVPVHIVTRLDKNTSGAVLVAKHKYVQEIITNIMKEGKIHKEYLALVHGKLENKHGIIKKNIKRKQGSIIVRETTEDSTEGKMAKTEYFCEKYIKEKDISVLKIILHTGRTHQIRVHMVSLGNPIVGDDLYIKENGYSFKDDIKRQALHARKLHMPDIAEYILGNEDKYITLKADIPEDIKGYM